ncbi:C40 family peptidase [Hymenobacter oligotrophus]|uniref:C40 family peptidase n=1 Tax=Hymenobacter oligotrophus TaxID=2319843 RepID=UPI001F090463|nr:C40 family peptidase [Hymenobacter oligotrophus]
MPNGKAASVAGGPAPIAEASFFSFPEGDNPASFRDSLNVGYYSQALGIKASYDDNASLLRTITEWLGTPYRFGSNSKSGTDCSGFVTRVFKEVYGISLVHSSRSMFNHVKRVSKDEMQTGDLVFFRRGPGQPIYHVGIYLKDGKFAHSATNGGVMVSSLQQPYYQRNFYAAGRVNRN